MDKREKLIELKKGAEKNWKRHTIGGAACIALSVSICIFSPALAFPDWAQWILGGLVLILLFAALCFVVDSYDDAKAIERAEDGIRSVNYHNGKYDFDLDIYLNETENKQ